MQALLEQLIKAPFQLTAAFCNGDKTVYAENYKDCNPSSEKGLGNKFT